MGRLPQFWACLITWISVTCSATHPYTLEHFHFTENTYYATISENALGKTYIVPSSKMGIHSPGPIQITYRIVDGNKGNIFKTEEYCVGDFWFLLVRTRTNSRLNRELQSSYSLTIEGIGRNGNTIKTQTRLVINVLDVNDLQPLFDPVFYNITVSEDTLLHHIIAQISATDGDEGINAEIYYSFDDWSDMFAIHPTMGQVTVTQHLNQSNQIQHVLHIIAEDRGPKVHQLDLKNRRTAELVINIKNANYYAPNISIQSLPSVVEHGNDPTLYAILKVEDKDSGDSGLIKSVKILDGQFSDLFEIRATEEEDEYNLVVREGLDRELMPDGLNLAIQASDRGHPPKTSQLLIDVSIIDTNDNKPKFSAEKYESKVEEIVPFNTPILFVKADDIDLGKNAEIVHDITSGNALGWFKINKRSGLISTADYLDRETQEKVILEVTAEDRANRGSRKSITVSVIIIIVDCNDNAPVFNISSTNIYVYENLPVGALVYKIEANDADTGENGYFSYTIANLNVIPFNIDQFTGAITTAEVLDYESMRRAYKVKVRASDWGSPFRQESEIILTIIVKDVNDNKPKFEKNHCTGFLSREAAIGTEMVVVPAIDFDLNIIRYQIQSGNDDGCFNLASSTGTLSLACNLSDYHSDKRQLVLVASDGLFISDPITVDITLVSSNRNMKPSDSDVSLKCQLTEAINNLTQLMKLVQDNNDGSVIDSMSALPEEYFQNMNAPTFKSNLPKYIEVSEGIAVSSVIASMEATDEDPGFDGMLVYSIESGDPLGHFKMGLTNGDLLVMSELDRESIPEYDVVITASDLGHLRKSSTTSLRIVILDENDNPPKFERSYYQASVSESILVNATVTQVFAYDDDTEINGRISYSLLSDVREFAVNPHNGIITVKRPLDREKQAIFNLVILATDNGQNSLSSTTTVTVLLIDINDNAPRFVPETYDIKIREDLPVGAVITTITAEDPDFGHNGKIVYSLEYGMDDNFQIDSTTGTIRLAKNLNFEMKQVYNISAHAKDEGSPSLKNACFINIEIMDVNENFEAPQFESFVLQGYVMENSPIGTVVMYLNAFDPDGNDGVSYSIRDGSGLARFTVDSNGTIFTSQIFDRETTSHYWFTVYAQDRGLVPLHSHVEIYVDILDENDNVPMTLEPIYYAAVLEEDNHGGLFVVQIKAEDLDQNPAQRLTFELTGGDPQNFFTINFISGTITTTKRKLDRETISEHWLEVTVRDNGDPDLSSTARVVVKVADINDNKPQFSERLFNVRIMATLRKDTDIPVHRVLATDKDEGPNAHITYFLKPDKGSARFRIHPTTGMIYSTKDLIVDSVYHITLKAVDDGKPQKRKSTARMTIRVVERPVVTSNAPAIKKRHMKVSVMENDPLGSMITVVEADDPDGDKLWYYITGGNTKNHFTIMPEDGSILIATELDWETCKIYNLTVGVSDGARTTYALIEIVVIDINDNSPVFTQAMYDGNVSENAEVGTYVLKVSATDQDNDSKLFYTIQMAVNVVSIRMFSMNSETGTITVADELDREVLARHVLTIMVRDQGIPSKRNLTRVVINVLDHNDHAPEFLLTIFEGRVFETAAVGTSVLQTLSIDRDKGEYAETEYSIITGNIGGAFNMDRTLGTIIVAKELDRDLQEEYNLVVMARDRRNLSLTSTSKVNIFITISNNAAPKFSLSEYTVDLLENRSVGTNIIAVDAKSQSSIVYKIIEGDENNRYGINPNSGVIFTKFVFDFEENHFYNLTVSATNIVGASTFASVLVHIVDENDNVPQFLKDIYFGNISEGVWVKRIVTTPDGTALVVKADDKDSNLNSLLTYEIIDSNVLKYFMIDPNTGAIWTVSPVDREEYSVIEFRVEVHDNGRPRLRAEHAAIVHIYIEDVNDCPPQFSEANYNTTVILPTYRDVAVIELAATDPDTVSANSLLYLIYSGNEEAKFGINSKFGTIYVCEESNMADSYKLNVHVSDGRFETSTEVFINVKRSTDSGLIFSREIYEINVAENSTEILKLSVIQPVGPSLNKHLKYKLLNGLELFMIGETSGVLRTKGIPLDREKQDQFHLLVQVTDVANPSCMAHVLVHLTVEDINDNRPIFVNQPYYSVVSLEAVPGDVVKRVTAIDKDDGRNGQLTYRVIEGDDEMFYIHTRTGQIFVKTDPVMYKLNTEITLIVEASDGGEPSLSAQTAVQIRVISKAHPLFEKQFYVVHVPENVEMHTAVIGVRADSPNGLKLLYSIVDGDPNGEFAVDFNIGVITVVGMLDFEITRNYLLTLRAVEMNTGAFAETYIRISVDDVNDHAPEFESLQYIMDVTEGIAVGSSVIRVNASDLDSGMNGDVHYSLAPFHVGKKDFEKFIINEESGLIVTRGVLDREVQDQYTFLAVAMDSGVPVLSSVVRVIVTIADLNDNAPVFDQPSYDCIITDQSTRGHLVTKVSASDPDISDAGLLEYIITAGNDRQLFSVDSENGLISLSNQRQPILHSSYTLNVSVTDGVFTSFARVSIIVRSSNHHTPSFAKQVYVVEFQEGLGEGTLVTREEAIDLDYGIFGMLTYTISSQFMQQYFTIDADTGEIFSRKVLDREKRQIFEIPVACTDNGGRMGFTTIHVSITDMNDNLPQFFVQEYKATVLYDAQLGMQIIRVKASDADIGKNGMITYSIHEAVGSRASELFSIDPVSGIISVKTHLQNSENEVYQFFVRAIDSGIPPLENNVPVEILVMGPLDRPPVFQQDTFAFFIPENQALGKVVGFVNATSQDEIHYSIVPGYTRASNFYKDFSIDQDGNIHLEKKLDRELIDMYILIVRAQTLTTPSLVEQEELHVHVMDVNDNHPQFESNPYIVTLPENFELGVDIIQVRVYDEDKGSRFQFSFDECSQNLNHIFSLDADSGWLRIMTPLDRETKEVYNITILVTDGVRIDSLSNTTLVQIHVTDCNDNPPVFSRHQFKTAVNEGALPGTVLLSVTTTDADIGINSNVNYYIIGGDLYGKFQVHKTGEVFVNGLLDRETLDHYELLLAATDGAHVSTATIMVDILDDNDNSPVCEKPFYQAILTEDMPPSKIVTRVHANDNDEAGTWHSEIEFFLSGDGAELFLIDKQSGIITTNAPLDREINSEYKLIASAVDGGGRSCTTEIFIVLEDVNDNAPRFIMTSDTITVNEDADINTLLARVSASDPDLGINHRVSFTLMEDTGSFYIDPDSGILSLVQHVDRESTPMYEIKVIATDKGSPPLSSETILRVLLLDVNDNPPEFEHLAYHETVLEDASVGSKVLSVFATSKDTGLNAKISYFIVAGNEKNMFQIDPETGTIYTFAKLNYEATNEYILTVQAKDHGIIPLHSMTIVNITIIDINDNSPIFSQTSYTISVGEDEEIGSDLLKVLATDADSTSNAIVTYSIVGGNMMGKFKVSPNEGVISIAAPLDRETISQYSVQLQATDSGVPQLFSIAQIDFEITDSNDNPPEFSEERYSLFVQEDRKIDTSILQFSISDDDLDPNRSPFSFDIYEGNEGGEFHVDKDGALRVVKKLNRIVRDLYNLTVRVFDNGSPPLHSDVSVIINIIEESSYPPDVTDLNIYISSYLDEFPGGIIGQLKASDADMYDELSFQVMSANRHLFDIDKHDGRIIAFAGLDSGEYLINVSVSDGKYSTFGSVAVGVYAISQEMVQNAVTVQFANLSPKEFFATYKKDFQRVLKRELNVRGRDVELINVQSSPDPFSRTRIRRASDTNLDVLFAVRKSPNAFYRSNSLRKKVILAVPALEKALSVVIKQVYNDICDSQTCDEGRCFSFVDFNKDSLVPIFLDDQSFVAAEHRYMHECRCTDGHIGEKCIPSPSSCDDDPCPAYRICETHPAEGYQCVCLPGKTGKRCDKDVDFSELCTDGSCRKGDKPMTFSGQSYAKWSLHSSINLKERLSLFMRIRTHKHTSNLMYAKSKLLRDYSILEIVNGMVQYRFNCGSGEGLVLIPNQVSDGQWHTIMLERRGNQAEILLDGKYSALTVAPGINEVLNLDTNDIYFGGEVEVYMNGYRDIRRGYEGCMEDIRIFNVRMPISGSNAVALNQEFVGVEFHCKEMGWIQTSNNVCSSFPCMNNGRCESTGLKSYICKCSTDSRYRGSRCEIDSNPCAENPCLNKGICDNVLGIPNEFHCSCPSGLQGKRCEYGRYCTPNPCRHGGTCIEAPRSSMCICMPGFIGDYCDESMDLCQNNPCQYGGTCHPTGNSYFCNCTDEQKGRHCEEVLVPSITSSRAGIGTMEIYVITGVAAGLIFIVLLFVIIRVWHRRKRERHVRNVTNGIADDDNIMLSGLMDEKRSCKSSNYNLVQNIPPSPRPPPVPNRPASYTPSVNTSMNTLNNFDTVRNYGSAADELENCHNIPTYPDCLQTFSIPPPPRSVASIAPSLPPPPPSNPASDTDSIQKSYWEFDYPNILESYTEEKKHPEKLAKLISLTKTPPISRSLLVGQDTTSISSLPVSESEDEQLGYHWDTSDWAPRPSLPNISELPVTEVLDSPCSSPHSNDSNTNVLSPNIQSKDENGIFTDPEYIESEYVGDSEYAENEFDNEDQDPARFYMNIPDYQQLLSLPQFQAENTYNLPNHNLDFRPGEYLPNYSFSEQNSENENFIDLPPPYEDGEFSQSEKSGDDNDSVLHYGFPSETQGFLPEPCTTDSEYNGDYIRIPSSVMDNMSVSMGGFTSTNASCSDISGLCEIEDSEINLSDEESAAENDIPETQGSLHTQV